MAYTLADRIRDYRNDPFFPTWAPYAVFLGTRDWVWYQGNGQPRRFKPSNFSNPVSSALNTSLFRPKRSTGKLSWWERVLLSLGF